MKTSKEKKTRRGMTIVEIVVALLLMALAVVVMGRLTATRLIETESLNYQYTMQAADAALYAIYKDFHDCNSYTITHDVKAPVDDPDPALCSPGMDILTISFDMGAAGTHIYAFNALNYYFYFNGATQFKCESFSANGDTQHLFVSMKLANGERLEYTIYA